MLSYYKTELKQYQSKAWMDDMWCQVLSARHQNCFNCSGDNRRTENPSHPGGDATSQPSVKGISGADSYINIA